MKLPKRLLINSLLLCAGMSLWAVPAKREVYTVTQPDGTTLKVKKVGDEFQHFTLTADGMLLVQGNDGAYCYAYTAPNGDLASTGVKALDMELRSSLPAEAQNIKDVDLTKVKQGPRMASRKIPQSGIGLDVTSFPSKGSPNVLILLVQYADFSFQVADPAGYFNGMLNQEGFSQYGGTGSCKDYFNENSGGQFTPNFVCYGPVTLPKKRNYYGGNDASGTDRNPQDMVVDAIKILDEDPSIDFSIFDNDGDGVLDNVYVIYAGQGEASYGTDDTVWPHSWDLEVTGKDFIVDGVRVNHYACSNEWQQNRPDGIGTFCHEFSHVMGLPDLYHTSDSFADYTPGRYSVLDYGPYNNDGCTPPAYSMYERNSLGWTEPEMITGPLNGELEHILKSNKGYLIPTSKDTEFFLLENRQQEGWDKYIPGHGMLIWHIDFNASVWAGNVVNNFESHQYVDIVEACGFTTSDDNRKNGYPFPGSYGVTSFTEITTPALKSWANVGIKVPITEIKEENGIITFLACGGDDGTPNVTTPVPVPGDQVEKSDSHFVAAWAPVENALDYEVCVYAVDDSGLKTDVNDMGADGTLKMADGWLASTASSYTSTGNYGESSPSLKLGTDGAWLQSPKYDAAVKSISYWRKGNSTGSGSSMTVMGLVNGVWEVIYTEEFTSTDVAKVIELNEIPADVHQVKFVYAKQRGNVALDDVRITTGGEQALPDYIDCPTGGATSLRIDKLLPGCSTYKYKVRSKGITKISPYSDLVTVDLGSNSISGIDADENAPVEYFDMLGRKVMNPEAGQILIRRQGSKATKVVM